MAKKELTKEEKAAKRAERKAKQAGVAPLAGTTREGENIVLEFKSAREGGENFKLSIAPNQTVTLSGGAPTVSELEAAARKSASYANVLAAADRKLKQLLGTSTPTAPAQAPAPAETPAAANATAKKK